jgi:hypothetical protein
MLLAFFDIWILHVYLKHDCGVDDYLVLPLRERHHETQ